MGGENNCGQLSQNVRFCGQFESNLHCLILCNYKTVLVSCITLDVWSTLRDSIPSIGIGLFDVFDNYKHICGLPKYSIETNNKQHHLTL